MVLPTNVLVVVLLTNVLVVVLPTDVLVVVLPTNVLVVLLTNVPPHLCSSAGIYGVFGSTTNKNLVPVSVCRVACGWV